jgi:hypothetical protein
MPTYRIPWKYSTTTQKEDEIQVDHRDEMDESIRLSGRSEQAKRPKPGIWWSDDDDVDDVNCLELGQKTCPAKGVSIRDVQSQGSIIKQQCYHSQHLFVTHRYTLLTWDFQISRDSSMGVINDYGFNYRQRQGMFSDHYVLHSLRCSMYVG